MAPKPYQSSLIPYEDEIIALRHRRPPMPYAQIAELLLQKYKLSICRETIFRFVKVRSRGRKMYAYSRNVPTSTSAPVRAASPGRPATPAANKEQRSTEVEFRFTPSDKLTRLTPEEAAARRKKVEEEGH